MVSHWEEIKWHQMTPVINQKKGRWSLVRHLKTDMQLYEEGGGSGIKPINVNLSCLGVVALFSAAVKHCCDSALRGKTLSEGLV